MKYRLLIFALLLLGMSAGAQAPSGVESVDLGLSVKWANMNVGAKAEEDYGLYFAWGDIVGYTSDTKDGHSFDFASYKWCKGSDNTMTKYCTQSSDGYNGFTDNKTTLEPADDAATANWGGAWRMPTDAEWTELLTKCTWTWTQVNGVNGYRVSRNGNSIFLPAAGYRYGTYLDNAGSRGYYWSASLYSDYSNRAYYVYFDSDSVSGYYGSRGYGQSVRPVYVESVVPNMYTITVQPNNPTYGIVTGGGNYDENAQITLTATPATGYHFLRWSDGNLDNPRTITVTENVMLTAVFAACTMDNGHAYVDLGLPSGNKWAICNVGATIPEEYGYYLAWGESAPKTEYSSSTYKFGSGYSYTKYNNEDNKSVLDYEDDAATQNWGHNWRMPTNEEWDELIANCSWEWTKKNGLKGYEVKSANNAIFIPVPGDYAGSAELMHVNSIGYYWSATHYESAVASGYYYDIRSSGVTAKFRGRWNGQSVRAIYEHTYLVTIHTNNVAWGSVTGDGIFKDNVQTTLTAMPNTGYHFVRWSDGNTDNPRTITVMSDTTLTAEFENDQVKGEPEGLEMVDLGLSVKWASMNVGATAAEEYGYYFAWGEVQPKEVYEWGTYKWGDGSNMSLTKYCTSSYGVGDDKFVLELQDDAANANWGDGWRMPTKEEMEELRTNCNWKDTMLNDVAGYLVTSKQEGNTNSIFLPSAGIISTSTVSYKGTRARYWASTTNGSANADGINGVSGRAETYTRTRCSGLPVRPVYSSATNSVVYTLTLYTSNSLWGSVSGGGQYAVNTPVQITATPNTGYHFVRWSDGNTDNPRTITVTEDITLAAEFAVDQVNGGLPEGLELVDLGLPSGTLWANMNVGADKPEAAGDYFAWGEIAAKSTYNWETYFDTKNNGESYIKYHSSVQTGYTVLCPEDDAARHYYGGNMRIPTKEEYEELLTSCNWTEFTLNGVQGYKVCSKSNENKSIFIPLAGFWDADGYHDKLLDFPTGIYWSSSLVEKYQRASAYGISNFFTIGTRSISEITRCYGGSIRAVCPTTGVATIQSNNEQWGSVTGGGIYGKGAMATLTAQAKDGYHFVRWSNGYLENPYRIKLEGDTTLIAEFAKDVAIEKVDLGLPSGNLWANMNVGAAAPECSGNYYAWGENEPKVDYSWQTYLWCKGSASTITKYCDLSQYGYNGFTDGKTELEAVDDVAAQMWGEKWRIPTYMEWAELRANCSWTWTTENGFEGYRVKGPNGNNIFIPAAGYAENQVSGHLGYGRYWTATMTTAYQPSNVYMLSFSKYQGNDLVTKSRESGATVRAIYLVEQYTVVVSSSDLLMGSVSGSGKYAENKNVTLTATPATGYHFLRWSDGNTDNPRTIKITCDTTLTAVFEKNTLLSYSGSAEVLSTSGRTSCEYVQLWEGGPKWATFNVGATITSYADLTIGADATSYYNYQDQAPYYNTANVGGLYAWNQLYNGRQTPWTSSVTTGVADVATTLWGSNWKTPTKEQLDTLQDSSNGKTTWTWCDGSSTQYVPGCTLKGFKVSGVGAYAEKSIFLPAAGYFGYNDGTVGWASDDGYYWSSTMDDSDNAWILHFGSDYRNRGYGDRKVGRSVRAVLADEAVSSNTYTITVLANDAYGTVTGAGTYKEGEQVTLTAVPNTGYYFFGWSDGNTYNPRTITVTEDITLAAYFAVETTAPFSGVADVLSTSGRTSCEYVQLWENGPRWATFNVGATITDYANLTVGADATPYSDNQEQAPYYNTANVGGLYPWNNPDLNGRQTPWTSSVTTGVADVATTLWGSNWKTPTKEQLDTLQDSSYGKTTWTWCDGSSTQYVPGCTLKGYKVTGVGAYAEKSIFLPAAGYFGYSHGTVFSASSYGFYWSSTMYDSDLAWNVLFYSDDRYMGSSIREYGQSVRAVLADEAVSSNIYTITVLANDAYGTVTGAGTYKEGEQVTLTAVPNTGYYFFGWSDGNTDNPRTITVTEDITLAAYFAVDQVNGGLPAGLELVDLGLSVKWANMNVGATAEEDYGLYFAWGDTVGYTKNISDGHVFDWANYKWCNGSNGTMTKYCTQSNYGDNGFTDGKTVLESADDATTANWGGSWRMPTDEEWTELRTQCTWTWTQVNGVSGYRVSASNGNSIFLPAVGCRRNSDLYDAGSYGYYWSASLSPGGSSYACGVRFYSDVVGRGGYYRYGGFSVRPVQNEEKKYTITAMPSDPSMGSVTGGGTYSEGSNATLNAVPIPGYEFVRWSDGNTDNPRTITVTEDITLLAEFEKISDNPTNEHEYVDLGLPSGTLWATSNLGVDNATGPTDGFFAWGATVPGNSTWNGYPYGDSESSLSKYCVDKQYGKNGFRDSKTQLEVTDDAATQMWGEDWRIPTNEDWQELFTYCIRVETLYGYCLLHSKINGARVEFYFSGYWVFGRQEKYEEQGAYWSADLHEPYCYDATAMLFDKNGKILPFRALRCWALSIRPVRKPVNKSHQPMSEDIETVRQEQVIVTKRIIDGQLYIIRDGRRYTTQGLLVE